MPAQPIETFAQALAHAAEQHIFPHARPRICLEPGRWICNDAVQILVTVIDRKDDDMIVTDAGTNAIGWDRFESDYAPVLNLTRPALREFPCWVFGSLCTPHDLWGYTLWGHRRPARRHPHDPRPRRLHLQPAPRIHQTPAAIGHDIREKGASPAPLNPPSRTFQSWTCQI